jgi:hypothetical protein
LGLKDFAGIFSRAFVIGYFVPAFFGVFVLRVIVHEDSLPPRFASASGATQALVIGGTALLGGLLLSALNRPLLRLLEGYAIRNATSRTAQAITRRMEGHWQGVWDHLNSQLDDAAVKDPTPAALRLQREFPARDSILPTRFGNVMRSFETHPRGRYGLDGIAIWPRLELLLKEDQRALLGDAQANVNFFVNALAVVAVGGTLFAIDRAWYASGVGSGALQIVLILVGILVVTMACYNGALQAVEAWGNGVRAAFDLYRADLYAKLGARRPASPEEELELAEAVNRCILFGEAIPVRFWDSSSSPSPE